MTTTTEKPMTKKAAAAAERAEYAERLRELLWTSPHTANPAAAGYTGRTRPRSVTHDGRRFLVWPEPLGPGWCWRERGTDAAYTASSEILAYLTIGAHCAVTRRAAP